MTVFPNGDPILYLPRSHHRPPPLSLSADRLMAADGFRHDAQRVARHRPAPPPISPHRRRGHQLGLSAQGGRPRRGGLSRV